MNAFDYFNCMFINALINAPVQQVYLCCRSANNEWHHC